ncbi:MAG TPA: hypothetical protein VF329_13570 [Gammaproteobacteria bacterium]
MQAFAALDPQLQGAIIGGSIAVAGSVLVAILGGIGWAIRHSLLSRARNDDLRRIKMQHVMERLIEVHDWAVASRQEEKASHPADHILWLCEVYGGSTALTAAATRLKNACDEWAEVRKCREGEITTEVQKSFEAFTRRFNDAYADTRKEALRVLSELAGK